MSKTFSKIFSTFLLKYTYFNLRLYGELIVVSHKSDSSDVKFYPLTPERWDELEELFGERGA